MGIDTSKSNIFNNFIHYYTVLDGIRQQRIKPQVLAPLLKVVMMEAMIYPIMTPIGTDACNLPIHDVTLPKRSMNKRVSERVSE